MKKLDFSKMEEINGAANPAVITADAGCLGVGLSFGLVNPVLGLFMGVGCSLIVYAAANK